MLMLASLALAADLPAGRYALAIRIATTAEASWLPTVRSVSTSRVLVDLRLEGIEWRQSGRVCAVDIVGSRVARITVPAPFVAAIPAKTVTPRLTDGGYYADMGLDSVGFVGDVMPATLADAPDWDHDGHPGATVHAKVTVLGRGELYVAQAAWLVLDGQVKDGGATGALRVRRFEQRTYGADPDWLALDTRLTADETRSSFDLIPIAADAGCDEVIAATQLKR